MLPEEPRAFLSWLDRCAEIGQSVGRAAYASDRKWSGRYRGPAVVRGHGYSSKGGTRTLPAGAPLGTSSPSPATAACWAPVRVGRGTPLPTPLRTRRRLLPPLPRLRRKVGPRHAACPPRKAPHAKTRHRAHHGFLPDREAEGSRLLRLIRHTQQTTYAPALQHYLGSTILRLDSQLSFQKPTQPLVHG